MVHQPTDSYTPEAAPAKGLRPSASERLRNPDALLTRTDLRELGLERRAVDVVFRQCAIVVLPGYSRPLIRVADYLELLEACTFRSGERVR